MMIIQSIRDYIVFRVSTHEGQIHLLTYKFSMVYRIPEEVYETKQKAKEINN